MMSNYRIMTFEIYPIVTSPLKTVFKHENTFNDWLAQNLDRLSEIFSVNFDLIKREATAEGLRLDLLAEFNSIEEENILTHKAAIEVQFGKSDSKHFGQLITYGAQHHARYCIWIAESFRPGHLQALQVLNDTNTDYDRHYFAVTAQLLSIGPNQEKGLKLSIADLDIEQPLTGKKRMTSKGALYWEFFEDIRSNLSSQPWFEKDKSTEASYFEFSSKIKSSHYRLIYGWNFLKTGVYRIYLAVYRKKETHSKESTELLNKVYSTLKSNYSIFSVPEKNIVKTDDTSISYITAGIHYPTKPDITNAGQFTDVVSWSTEMMKKFYELLQPLMLEISKDD